MTIVHRLLASTIAVVLMAGVIATFTVEGSDSDNVASRATTSTVDTAVIDDDDAEEDGDPTDDDGQEGEGDDEGGGDDTATTIETTTTTAQAPTTTEPTSTTPPPLGVTATAAGSYTYDVTGCCDEDGNDFVGTSILTVPEPDADGRQVQVQEPQDSGRNGASETTYRFTPEGTYLEAIEMSSDGMSFRLEATSPFLLIPAGSAAGTVTQGHLQHRGTTMGQNVVIDADVTFRLMEVTDQTSTAELEVDISGSAGPCNIAGDTNSTIVARTLDQLPLDTRSDSDTTITGALCPMRDRMTSNIHSVLRQ